MDAMRIGLTLVGLGGLLAGVVGVLLPSEHRLAAVLALVAGAGAGVIVLAIGIGPQGENEEKVFLVGAALGLVTEIAVLGLTWRRARAAP
jgi:hypothetical protein